MSTLVSVSQASSGIVTSTLYLDTIYFAKVYQLIPTTANTVTVEMDNSAGYLCSTAATYSPPLTVACPGSMGLNKKCLAVTCGSTSDAIKTTGTDQIRAIWTICPPGSTSCGFSDTALSNPIALTAAAVVPPPPPPVDPQPTSGSGGGGSGGGSGGGGGGSGGGSTNPPSPGGGGNTPQPSGGATNNNNNNQNQNNGGQAGNSNSNSNNSNNSNNNNNNNSNSAGNSSPNNSNNSNNPNFVPSISNGSNGSGSSGNSGSNSGVNSSGGNGTNPTLIGAGIGIGLILLGAFAFLTARKRQARKQSVGTTPTSKPLSFDSRSSTPFGERVDMPPVIVSHTTKEVPVSAMKKTLDQTPLAQPLSSQTSRSVSFIASEEIQKQKKHQQEEARVSVPPPTPSAAISVEPICTSQDDAQAAQSQPPQDPAQAKQHRLEQMKQLQAEIEVIQQQQQLLKEQEEQLQQLSSTTSSSSAQYPGYYDQNGVYHYYDQQ
ncbi:hypothetical protein BDR26DRAFT_879322 [Obelidium mucronatum]|nr:hypothetical protein BDR26DRAFT_879322 [Obelidium mucronatum]